MIAELHRAPAGGFDAAIGQGTDDDDLLDAVLLELLGEVSVGKVASTAKAAATIAAMVLLSVRQDVKRNRPCVKRRAGVSDGAARRAARRSVLSSRLCILQQRMWGLLWGPSVQIGVSRYPLVDQAQARKTLVPQALGAY